MGRRKARLNNTERLISALDSVRNHTTDAWVRATASSLLMWYLRQHSLTFLQRELARKLVADHHNALRRDEAEKQELSTLSEARKHL
jgi:hypothetical protein